MKKILLVLISVFLFWGCEGNGAQSVSNSEKSSSVKDYSYSIGYDISKGFKDMSVDIDVNSLKQGLVDGYQGKSKFSDEDMQQHLTNFRVSMMKTQQENQKRMAVTNLEESNNFFAQNKTKEGVITTSSGLQYKVISNGSGKKPRVDDVVSVHYKGELLDGTVFDSSYDRGNPVQFAANQVIKGWTEALQLMSTGSKWLLFIPPNLGYGENGYGMKIGPNAALIFEVELLDIVQK